MSQVPKQKKFSWTIVMIVAIAAAVVAVSAILLVYPIQSVKTIDMSSFTPEMRDAISIGQEFLLKSPTFAYDGINDSVTFVQPIVTLDSNPRQYVINYTFDSSHAGYGDRSSQVLAQVITHHVTQITVSNKEVISALVDKKWDELRQIFITSLTNPSIQITTNKEQYKTGETVNFTITNDGNTRLFPKGWGYSIIGMDGKQYAPNGVLRMMLVALPPGQSMHWTWDQLDSNSTQVNSGNYRIIGSYIEEGTEKEVSNFKDFVITK